LAGLSSRGLLNGDQEAFSFETDRFVSDVAFAVVENTDEDAMIIDRLDELLPEMVVCKAS
jgi:hypothetical protein